MGTLAESTFAAGAVRAVTAPPAVAGFAGKALGRLGSLGRFSDFHIPDNAGATRTEFAVALTAIADSAVLTGDPSVGAGFAGYGVTVTISADGGAFTGGTQKVKIPQLAFAVAMSAALFCETV